MKRFTTLVAPELVPRSWLAPELVLVDCRASLANPEAGRESYAASHLPSAVFADLQHDLSGAVVPGVSGRHPLPKVDDFVERLRAWGITNESQIIAYDDAGGAFAARLWWLLRWLGHDSVAVLDGGYSAWLAAGLPTTVELTARPRGDFSASLLPELVVQAEDVAQLGAGGGVLIDARAPERFRGDVEPIDAVAGHIPGAVNLPFGDNLVGGRFRTPSELRQRFEQCLGEAGAERAVLYCGSGVTACHDVLAFVHAGLAAPRLYAGSWSEWITAPERAVAKGAG